MMETREITCIGCPVGCLVKVGIDNGGILKIEGFTCARGEAYARKECTNPTRIVTSTVLVENGVLSVLPVKTATDIPKGKIFDCMRQLKGLKVKAPVKIGDVILRDVAHTGVDIVATRDVEAAM
jgi:CxxC motif-containing protein